MTDICGDKWQSNSNITCELDIHDKDIRHRGVVRKTEVIVYPTAHVTSEQTDTVEWEDPMISITRALDRVKPSQPHGEGTRR